MPRPNTGPYRKGVDNANPKRSCDSCGKSTPRAAGDYLKVSALRQIWCCDKCLSAKRVKTNNQHS